MIRRPTVFSATLLVVLLATILVPGIVGAQAQPSARIGDPGPTGTRIEREGIFANYYPSQSGGSSAAILLLGGSEGGLAGGEEGKIKALVAEGFAVLELCYFGCPGTSPQMVNVPLETFQKGLGFLRAQPNVDPDRVAIVGVSKGAEAALLTAARDSKLRAVVAAMPSSVSWPGITRSFKMQPSWTLSGEPVPFLPYAFGSYAKSGVFGMYVDALPNRTTHPAAVIPIERIAAPILLICGEADRVWPSCGMTDQLTERLATHQKSEPVVLRYKNAGHAGFGTPIEAPVDPEKAKAVAAASGGTVEDTIAARADSWPKVVAFLKQSLQ